MTESRDVVKSGQTGVAPLVTVVVKTEGKDEAADRSFTLALDGPITLSAARSIVAGDLHLDGRWSFLADGAVMTASAEAAQTVEAAIERGEGRLQIQREMPVAERKRADEAALRQRDAAARGKQEAQRKAEEAALREHAELARSALKTLQDVLQRPEALRPEDVNAAFSALKHAETLSKFGGDTGDALRTLSVDDIEKIVRSLGLPRTTSRAAGDGAFLVNELVARLRAPEGEEASVDPLRLIAERCVVAVNEVETRVETFQEEWQKKACESGFSQIAATLAVAYKSPAFRGALSANYSHSDQRESAAHASGEVVYLVGTQEVRKARVVIPPEMIVLSPLVEAHFAAAAAGGAEALRPVFDRHGYFVITEYTLGGKLYTSETEARSASAAAQASKFQRSFGAAVDAAGYGGHVAGAAASSGEEARSESRSESRQRADFHLSAKGGNVTDRHDPKQWIASLKPDNWEVIAYGRLVPIFEFLGDPALRERCRQAVEALARASDDLRDAEAKAAAQAELARWAVMSRGVADYDPNERQRPADRGRTGRPFAEVRCQVSTAWVEVPQGMYFKGAQLKVDGEWLKIVLFVTDAERAVERMIEAPASDGVDGRLGDAGIYLDKTPLRIPPQQRIVGLRLRRLANPANRVGLEVKLGDLGGAAMGTLLNHEDNREHYDESARCTPCVAPTMVPGGKVVTGIRLENLGDGVYGFEVVTLAARP